MAEQPQRQLRILVKGPRIHRERTRGAIVDADRRIRMETGVDDDMGIAEQDIFVTQRSLDVDRIDVTAHQGGTRGIKRAATPAVARGRPGRIVVRERIVASISTHSTSRSARPPSDRPASRARAVARKMSTFCRSRRGRAMRRPFRSRRADARPWEGDDHPAEADHPRVGSRRHRAQMAGTLPPWRKLCAR